MKIISIFILFIYLAALGLVFIDDLYFDNKEFAEIYLLLFFFN